MREQGIEPIDMVVVNLYPFEQTIKRPDVTQSEAIEQIDIGGPAMIRSAAKNWQSVAVVVLPEEYARVIEELKKNDGSLSLATRGLLAREAFGQTSRYDMVVVAYLVGAFDQGDLKTAGIKSGMGGVDASSTFFATDAYGTRMLEAPPSVEGLKRPPDSATFTMKKSVALRYGENPHQIAALYNTGAQGGIANLNYSPARRCPSTTMLTLMPPGNLFAILMTSRALSSSIQTRRELVLGQLVKKPIAGPWRPIQSLHLEASLLSITRLTKLRLVL